ncbi:hypothetical protein GobsT_17830 [Gemmata obscuriglobus]|uniref:Uncharacterized protein n=1 Tax=Gemmata obscuriglobus TaxID=114 RepID=A0A2Z3H8E1_9BACT|nr:hypothetical protein [Gemmata obscuriglobus]AWM39846.1 hypothetical protein C1280_24445 [Gemmata obscuriglobus]QEG27030.1 hypothetical protein GobsT_17830 [Gemmata obscuriglobus]VTS03383.1 unnamed protein product [Gemmata obscuriglobus UQM 2246]
MTTMNTATIQAVKAAYEAYKGATLNQREKARDHGDWLLKLREECEADGINYTDVLKEHRIPQSTAYEHKALAENWDGVQTVCLQMGLEFWNLSIKQIVRFARNPDEMGQYIEEQKEASNRLRTEVKGAETKNGDVASQSPKSGKVRTRKPKGADKEREAEAKNYLKEKFNMEVKVKFITKNQTVPIKLGNDIIVIIPQG